MPLLKTHSLTPQAYQIIRNKATEAPFTGHYTDLDISGSYLCRQCGLALFRSHSKFLSSCGWPSFDDEIPQAVRRSPDADGRRTEILCARCDGHLGHIFHGEHLTDKNTRYCVNSLSIDFVTDQQVIDTEETIVAGGCFWGVELLFSQLNGIVKTEVGYTGGQQAEPNYSSVCTGQTGHVEAVRVIYDKDKLSFEAVIKYFFEIHDPTQTHGQGPDRGPQYLSKIFYYDETQKNKAESVIALLEKQNVSVATILEPITTFWLAEEYHQQYYQKKNERPYCHFYQKKF